MPCIFICQIWQLYPSQQRKYFSLTLNKCPRTGERNPPGCREKQEYLNRQEHGKLSSSSCLRQLEGRGDDSPWETQPKHSFFSRPNPSKLQEISASFTILPKDTILSVAGHARDVVWDGAQHSFSQSYYKEVVTKQNESVWLKTAVLTQNISNVWNQLASWEPEKTQRAVWPLRDAQRLQGWLSPHAISCVPTGGEPRRTTPGELADTAWPWQLHLEDKPGWEGGSTRGAEAQARLRVAP